MSELLKMLTVLETMAGPGVWSAPLLASKVGVSRATFYRYIDELRHMGADVVLVLSGTGRARGYECRNWSAIHARVETWKRLEQDRSLVGGLV